MINVVSYAPSLLMTALHSCVLCCWSGGLPFLFTRQLLFLKNGSLWMRWWWEK